MNLHLNVAGKDYEVHLEPVGEAEYQVTVDGEPFDVELAETDQGTVCSLGSSEHVVQRRGRALFLDGERADVAVRHLAQSQAGAGAQAGGEVRPPMPGRIVEVLVAEGDEVEPGQTLVVLEAMKMQNEIQAPGAATVAEVRVSEGDAVEADDVLVVLE